MRILSRKKQAVMLGLDFLGKIVFSMCHVIWKLVRTRQDFQKPEIKKILLTRLDPIGDVILSTPILEPLRKKFPDASISYLLSSHTKEIVEGNPNIDEIITFNAPWQFSEGIINDVKNYLKVLKLLRTKKFDLVLDLEGNAKSIFFISYMSRIPNRVSRDWTGGGYLLTKVVPYDEKKHMIEYQADIAKAVGAEVDDPQMFIPVGSEERYFVDSLFKQNGFNGSDMLVVLSPGARRITKFWPVERFSIIGDWLVREFDARVIITGAPTEVGIAENVHDLMEEKSFIFAGKTRTLKHLAAIMERTSLVIGNDSGPMHIAAAVETPTVTLFSSGLSSEYRPYGDIHEVVQKGDLNCRPCTERKCTRPEGLCMELITVGDVKKAILEQMKIIMRE